MMTEPVPATPTSLEISERVEARWATIMFAIIVMLLAIVVFTAVHYSSMPPSRVEVIDVRTLHLSGEFLESNLGTGIVPTPAAAGSWKTPLACGSQPQ